MFTSKARKPTTRSWISPSTILLHALSTSPLLGEDDRPTFGSGSIHAFAGPSAGVRLSAKRQLASTDSIGVEYGK